jgi:hypothetical protein
MLVALTVELSFRRARRDDDATLIPLGRKRIRSGTSALNQVNNEHNDGNHEQKMDQTAANMADKTQKPEHH